MAEQIKVTREGAVETIAFSNPPKNFITRVMLEEFYQELLRVRKDPSIRVLVLTGGVKDSFVTHYDVSELIDYSKNAPIAKGRVGEIGARVMSWFLAQAHCHPLVDRFLIRVMATRSLAEQGSYFWARCMELLDTMPKVAIAAINGLSLGGGCELSLCCDFRFMAKGPNFRIGLPEILVGIIPGGTGTPLRLPRVVGEAKALEILLTGKLYTPEEALDMGLIHEMVEPERLMPTVMELAQRLASRPPIAIAAAKRDVRTGSRMSFPNARAVDMAAVNAVMSSDDARLGMSSYVNDLVAKYDGLDLERMLKDVDALVSGRMIQYQGK